MSQEPKKSLQIQEIIGLKPQHFADLIRASQLIFDPSGGISGRRLKVDWESFGIPQNVANNLKCLGEEFQYTSPYISAEVIWNKLIPETRIWFIENKDKLWQFEEIFPALDED
ncbi:hypothetical protein B6N60_00382 [Richelia sinica FACHB-800]|jgi:cell division ATPase FtsA|uniref:Uncharacterized protein n=1 Tax=Richelia sinica FACHB-800 TaxID=1357546 RepID=A0A975Y333_9NOST|nr:hypothetical protein [Richelia sinica]MBD2662870.1 hypothetical protein [Richelia sinica FACHB-800]QXE21705.1 hypothetical protein B6N60_00382 [Richelia sinica FACHB-800]